MKRIYFLQFLFFIPLVFVVLGLVAFSVGLDQPLPDFFRDYRLAHEKSTVAVRLLTDYGGLCLLSLYAWMLWRSIRAGDVMRTRFVLAAIVVQFVLLGLVARILKISVGSPRPNTWESEFQPFSWSSRYHSFPSGHTLEASGLANGMLHRKGLYSEDSNVLFAGNDGDLSWGECLRALGWGLLPALMAFTRVYLGMHHLADLLGAGALAFATPWLVHWLMRADAFWRMLPWQRYVSK